MRQAVYDLHRLLLRVGIPGPYVLVGHSLGGTLARVYATQYPDEVAGMVLLFADRLRQEFPLGNKPLIVLTKKPEHFTKEDDIKREQERVENTQSLTLLSKNSLRVVAEKSGHEIHLDQPELVVKAIRAVVEAAKSGTALKPFGSGSSE